MDLEGIVLSEISHTKTNTTWYHLHVESKENHEQTSPNRNRVIDTEDRDGGDREIGEGDYEVPTSSYKLNESWYEMYSVGNTVNNYVKSLYGDRW